MSMCAILGINGKDIEGIKGNGWGIDPERIELNGVNAKFIDYRDVSLISLGGPAVEDIFKCLRDLIKKNGALTEENERLAKENQGLKKFCEEQREYFNKKIEKRDERIDCLTEQLKKEISDAAIIKNRLDEKTENHDRLQDLYLKEVNKRCTLNEHILELEEEIERLKTENNKIVYTTGIQDHEFKSLKEKLNEECDATRKMYDAMMASPDEIHARAKGIIEGSHNTKFTSVYDTDITRMYPCTYSDAAKEVLSWIDGEMKNNTVYATKIFNKEYVGNIFSITFCKVPVKSEEDE